MVVFLIILVCIVFLGLRAADANGFFEDYMSKEQTTAINGVFTVLVIFRHAVGYLNLSGPLDQAFSTFNGFMSQLIVVTFLFYSGYGIMESFKKKGMGYIRTIPTKRFLKVLYHFDIAVLLYLILDLILKISYKPKDVILAFTGWTSIGNSNWYIFVVLVMYVFVFLSFLLTRGNKYAATALTIAFAVAFVYWNIRIKRPSYCYNTAILFPAGMAFSLFKNQFDRFMTKKDIVWFSVTGLSVLLFAYFYSLRKNGIEFYTIWACLFMMIIVELSMKIKIDNNILNWFGTHVFSVYILQRLPMMVLRHLGFAGHRYAFIIISFAVTVVLAVWFDFAMKKLDGILFSGKNKLIRRKSL